MTILQSMKLTKPMKPMPPTKLMQSSRIMNVVTELLTGMEEKKLENMDALFDTKNYGSRVNAMIKNNKPYVHAEWFDDALQEYYQIEGFLGACRVSMSRGSLFMKSYLGKDYSKYYSKEAEKIFAAYKSLEDVKQLSLQENDSEKQTLCKQRLSCLRKLDAEINRTIQGIAAHSIFIGHTRAGVSVEDLLHFYHLEKEFDCYTRKETMDVVLPNNHSDVKEHKVYISNFETLVPRRKSFKCKGTIEITIEDLYRALEFGIENARDICSLKEMYGTLDNIFVR